MSLLRRAAVAVFAAGVLFACSSRKSEAPKPLSGFCDLAKAAIATCTSQEPVDCDSTLAASCTSLATGISPTAMQATNDCLTSGVCGATLCLTRSQQNAQATRVQADLATKYCALCESANGSCQTRFYDPKSKEPGSIVLPYSDAVTTAVASQCLADASGCGLFATCAQSTVATTLGSLVPPDLATCISTAFTHDTSTTQLDGGAVVASCTPDNCKGCCRDDSCHDGTSEAGCGINGNACATCSAGATCLATGECHTPCSPDNCKGCCDGDNCIPGDTDDKCAAGGVACTNCKETNADYICSAGTCIDGSCKATCLSGCCTAAGCQDGTTASQCGTGGAACVNCGAGQTCNASQACQLNPASLWDVYAVSAVIPAKKADGSSWDPLSGLPDPYAKITASLNTSSTTQQTTVQTDTLTPTWDQTTLSGISAQELMNNLTVELWDQDTIDSDDVIGGCRITLSAAVFNNTLLDVSCGAGTGTVAVKFSFKLVPHP